MSLRHRVIRLPINPFARKLSDPVDRGWGDTIVGPVETPREPDGREPGEEVSPDPDTGKLNAP